MPKMLTHIVEAVDLSVFIDDKVYIFEFKVNSSGALVKLKLEDYHQKYMNRYNDIYLVGVAV